MGRQLTNLSVSAITSLAVSLSTVIAQKKQCEFSILTQNPQCRLIEVRSDHFRNALTIAQLQSKYSPGHEARTKYKLAQALRRLPELQLEADEKALKAEKIYHDIVKESNNSAPPNGEDAYDNLIANFWR